MKKIIAILSMALALGGQYSISFAAQTNYDIGSIAGAELKLNLSTRFLATGSAGIALVNDRSAVTLNPAGLALLKGGEVGVMGNAYLQDTTLGNITFAQNVFEGASVGANIMVLNFGELEKVTVDTNGLPVIGDTFTPLVLVGSAGYGQKLLDNLSVGGAVKFYSLNIDSSSYTSVAVDLGMHLQLLDSFSTALTVQNLGTSVADSSLPMLAKAGLAYELPIKATAKDSWHVLLDVNLPFGDINYTSANIGTEYWYNEIVAVRAGYIIKDTGDLGGLTNLTAGLGGKIPIGTLVLGLDYAMLSYGDLGLTHQFELSLGW